MSQKTILVVDDEKLLRWSLRQKLESAGFRVVEADSGEAALAEFRRTSPDLVTLDIRLPDTHGLKLLIEIKKQAPEVPVIMITAFGAIDDAVKALQIGAYDYLEKPLNFDRLLHSISNALETRKLRNEVERTRRVEQDNHSLDQIIGKSPAMQRIKEMVRRVAESEATTILIQGESGTGKDLVAKALHFRSHRARNAFMILNCAAIPEALLESELFGHERGAFTDAKNRKLGLFEMAHEGTIFFDEISEMPLNLQAKLLRVLEDRSFRRIGGVREIHSDARVICASNRNLEQMVDEGKFRSDLFYRLSVIPITLPPLRERESDIEDLVQHFIAVDNRRFSKEVKGVTPVALRALKSYSWPGNVREVKNLIERALILQDEGYIDMDMIPSRVTRDQGATNTVVELPIEGVELYQVEKNLIEEALRRTGWNQSAAARLLSITRDTLRYKVKKYELEEG